MRLLRFVRTIGCNRNTFNGNMWVWTILITFLAVQQLVLSTKRGSFFHKAYLFLTERCDINQSEGALITQVSRALSTT